MLFLNRQEVESLLDLDQLVDALAAAMVELSAGSVSMPPRVAAFVAQHEGLLGVMPVYLDSSRTLATKLVSVFPRNAAKGLPSHHAVIAVFDHASGAPLALMDGEFITAARTAAGSALATRLLAPAEAKILAIVGAGVQARSHARAVPRVRPIREIRIAARSLPKAQALAEELAAALALPVRAHSSLPEALDGADVICTTTHAVDPVLKGEWLAPGVHINSVGLNPRGRELDADAVKKSLVVVESRQSALAPPPSGANDLLWPIRDGLITAGHIHAEIGELIANSCPARTSQGQITLYKSVGVAVQDAVAANLVLTAAQQKQIGRQIDL